jgi:serine/threonine-protein kinase
MPARAPEIHPGALMPGTKYRVVKELGAGGMGIVYQVVKPPEIQGVLKLMSAELAAHEEFRLKFLDEVNVLARLEHPNIVRVSDYDVLADGTPYYVMELLTGRTLRDVLLTLADARQHVPPRVAFEVTRQLCEALHCAHTHEPMVVHRDIKPENIFLHSPKHGEPVVKLIDFGVVARADRVHDGSFVGTWRYAAPEQIRGERATPATDIYAVGLVLYEMLCMAGPFDHLDTGKLVSQAHLHEVPAPISTRAPWVPKSIEQLVAAALAKDPKHRPRDAHAFAERLFELEWASDGKDPYDGTKEGPLSRVLSTGGDPKKPSSKNLAAAKPAADRLGDVPLIGVPQEALHYGNTLKGVGEKDHAPTTPDDDALLDGLLARRTAVAERQSGPRLDQQVVIRPSPKSPDVVAIETPRSAPASRPDPPTSPRVRSGYDTDTFASQESDAGRLPRAKVGRFAIALAMVAVGVATAATIVIVRHRVSAGGEATAAIPPPPAPSPPPPTVKEVASTAPPAPTSADVPAPPPSAPKHATPTKPGRPGTKPDSPPKTDSTTTKPAPTPSQTSTSGMIRELGGATDMSPR